MTGKTLITGSIDAIEQNIEKQLNAAILSSHVYLSKYHYQRLFREIVGQSLMDYIKKRRFTLAGSDLLTTNISVLEVALKYGYSSHESFTRGFKAYMGVSPADYRKYNLSAICQKNYNKENIIMSSYRKITDEIIKGLNEFIAQAKHTTEFAEKNCVPQNSAMFKAVTKSTNNLTKKLESSLRTMSDISPMGDEISNGFEMIKTIENLAFSTSAISFAVNLYNARNISENAKRQQPICQRFNDLEAKASAISNMIFSLLHELARLICLDVKSAATLKVCEVIEEGKRLISSLDGYDYIMAEIKNIVQELEGAKAGELCENHFEDLACRMEIIILAADLDVTRNSASAHISQSVCRFFDSIVSAKSFFSQLSIPRPPQAKSREKELEYLVRQANILLFFTKGEVEKLAALLSQEQAVSFDSIIEYTARSIKAPSGTQEAVLSSSPIFSDLADSLLHAHSMLEKEGAALAEKGGTVAFLASRFKQLSLEAKGL